jgi:hypothetical protein
MACGAISDPAESRGVPAPAREVAFDFAAVAFWARTGRKDGKSEGILSPSETSGFVTQVVSP